MHTIAYMSVYTGSDADIVEDLRNICKTAKAFNPLQEITGVLFYHKKRFLQLIEGEQDRLELLMNKIQHDDRHCQLIRVVDTPVQQRGFEDWNMDTFNLESDQRIDLEFVSSCTDLFSINKEMDGSHFIEMVKTVLKYRNSKQFCVI